MIQNITPEKIETIIREEAAKHILPRFRSLKEEDVATKTGPNDLVTLADIETEYALIERLEREFPGSKVIGEEGVSRGDVDLKKILTNPPDLLWVVDPVDGTWNFAHGSEIFGCMVALLYKSETVMSWIYHPTHDKFATAESGQGATYAGKKISTARPRPLEELHGYISHMFASKEMKDVWQHSMQYISTAGSMRCAAHSYMRLARGLVDFHISTKTNPWDHLAGDLLVREAGGVVKSWDGEAYHPEHYRQGLLSACHPDVWDMIHTHFVREVMRERKL